MPENYFQNSLYYSNINRLILHKYEGEQRVLDIGWGTGLLAKSIHQKNPHAIIYGIDLSSQINYETEKNLAFFSLQI